MNQWEQHYYTWSTNSLSGNKVGLGIVAATTNNDRNYLRIMENQGARSEVCREEENLTIERLSYHEELPGYIRTGATPCASGADKRNNKFVHLYSIKEKEKLSPEDYLTPLLFQKQWDGEQKLSVWQTEGEKKGRKEARRILASYNLENRLEELFADVYRCLLAGEKPLSIVNGEKSPSEFAEFARQMMILIHYMIPVSLRKEADYVSYVKGNSQEAHFLFRQSGGDFTFDFQKKTKKSREFALMEEEFYQKLAKAFLKEDDSFEKFMKKLEHFLLGLFDKRNQLEKCIFACMASEAGKTKNKEDFFIGVERLMYWARKDKSLIPAIQDATADLDFHSMEEGDLLSYVNLLLTGAGGETKEIAYGELNRMLRYYYRAKDDRFDKILDRICKKNRGVYEKILKENDTENGFTKMVLYQPIENRIQLAETVKNHESFLEEKDYRYYIASTAYVLYQKAKSREARQEIARLGKKADQEVFVKLKQKDVETLLKKAKTMEEFFRMTDQMEISEWEEPIRKRVYEIAMELFTSNHPKLLPELYPVKGKGERGIEAEKQKDEVRLLLFLGQKLSFGDEIKKDLYCYYENLLQPVFKKMMPKELIHVSLGNQEDKAEHDLYFQVVESLAFDCYLALLKEKREEFYQLNKREWIRFVLKLVKNQEKKKAKEAIAKTREVILAKQDLLFLADINQTLKNYGAMSIGCPKQLWDGYDIQDFAFFYENVADISLIKCEDSPVYLAMEILYHFIEKKAGKEDRKNLRILLKTEKELGEKLLQSLAALWGKNENLNLDFFYEMLEETFGKDNGKKFMEKAVRENEKGLTLWREYEKKHKKEVEKKMRQKEKGNPLANIIEDIMSQSIWAVLLGFYGFMFIRFRASLLFAEGYSLSIKVLIGLVIVYACTTFFGRKKKQTPGAMLYLVGISIFLMNMGLSMDTQKAEVTFYLISAVIALILKVIHVFFRRSHS